MQQTLVNVVLPEMGESVTEGSVTSWRKKPGDFVAAGEAIVDVTTDKVDVEVPSPAAGRVTKVLVEEGKTVKVGAPLAEIDTAASPDGESKSTTKTLAAPQTAATPKAPQTKGPADAAAPDRSAPTSAPAVPSSTDASPLARRMAAKRGADLSRVQPAYPDEPIRRADVAHSLEQPGKGAVDLARPATSQAGAGTTEGTITPLRGAAASLAEHMERSLAIPTATSFRTLAVDVLDVRRRELNAALRSAGRAEKISFTHVLAYAIAQATKAVPAMSASFRHGSAGPERVERGAHLGLAVDVKRPDGSRMLVVPVVRDAASLDFAAFHRAYEALVEKARASTLGPAEMSGATLTLTNPGGIGTVASVPRLMLGQGAIIAAGAIDYPPGLGAMPEATLRSLGVVKVMTLTSTYDHRIIQGAQSGEFLRRIDQLLSGADGFYEAVFSSLGVGPPPALLAKPSAVAPAVIAEAGAGEVARAAAAGMGLVMRYRTHGVNAAHLDPLSDATPFDTALEPASLGLDHSIMEKVPATVLRVYAPGETLADVLNRLRDTYCSTIAYEVEHISNHEQRSWMRQQIESGAHRKSLSRERKLQLLERLTRVESFERYLRKTFLGQKTFSIEGLDAMVPMLEEMLHMLADEGTAEVRLGMAHRGRLAVITHVVDRPYEEVLLEFEQAQERGLVQTQGDVTGDVKYHQGASGTYETENGKKIRVVLANNPSHLEAVDPVVEGQTRAVQTDRRENIAKLDTSRAAAILIHGDAAFVGQGVVAEVFNMQGLAGYTTGGTLHIIANNQIGFTTLPRDGRSTRYASDPAKGFDVPIIHVNADDLEAAIAAVHLAVEYRRRFHRDAVIDLIGYRRFGHNEADEPAYTQPDMYERIEAHPTALAIFARRLVEEGTLSEADIAASAQRAQQRVAEAHASIKARTKNGPAKEQKARPPEPPSSAAVETAVPADLLSRLNLELLRVPADFTVHPKLARQLERRKEALAPGGEVDWGLGEALAFASLIRDGAPIRVTGQDTERGTFSHRHLVLHDAKTGAAWTPMQHLTDAKASFEVFNSPLSEYAVMGFEYGYSAEAPDALVIWEAQFGDFSNGGQIIIDQFIAAGRAKWQQTSRLTLLLPHAYEGAGPEHSSARLERYLQLAAQGNFRIANPTTPAQYFHLLRDQAKNSRPRPLVIMTPKSLLRLKAASSTVDDLAHGGFAPLLDDPKVEKRDVIKRLALCSGKVYYDLIAHPQRVKISDLAIARVELLEPFPFDEVLALVASYPNVKQVTWVQEEPKNMGARAFVSRRIREKLTPRGIIFDYIGRPDRASPSEGYPGAHAVEQERIISEVLGVDAKGRS